MVSAVSSGVDRLVLRCGFLSIGPRCPWSGAEGGPLEEKEVEEAEEGEEADEDEDEDRDDAEAEADEEGAERPKLDEGFYEIEAVRRKRVRKVVLFRRPRTLFNFPIGCKTSFLLLCASLSSYWFLIHGKRPIFTSNDGGFFFTKS